jgi:HK97 family phage portal protein
MEQRTERRGWFRRRRGAHEDRSVVELAPGALTAGAGSVTPTTALAISDVWACTRVLVNAASSVPLLPYRRQSGGGRQRLQGALADLLRQPAPGVTQSALLGQLMAHLQLYGNAFLAKGRDDAGKVARLWLLHPERVAVALVGDELVFKVRDERGHERVLGLEDIVHVRSPLSIDGLLGLSPIRSCRVALGLAQNLATHADAFFGEGGRPDGILKVGNAAGQEQADRIKAQWKARRGNARAGRGIAVVTGDVEFTPVSGPLDDLQFVEQRALSTAEVARIFGVPGRMVGAPTNDPQTYANVESVLVEFVTYSLRPWLVAVEQAITADADLCRGPSVYVEHLVDALLRSDSMTRAQIYALALDPDKGWLDREEVRQLENREAA